MRKLIPAAAVVLSMTGFCGCQPPAAPDELAGVPVQFLSKEELEECAWDKNPTEVRTSLGAPTAIRQREDGEWWFYNHIQLRYDDGRVVCPQIHFQNGKWASIGYMDPDTVESFMNDDHWFAAP